MSAMPKTVKTQFVKTKFIGLLRDLLRRFDESEARSMELPRPVTAATPFVTAPPAAAAPPPSMSTSPPARPENENELELPLQTVLAALPIDLRAKIMQAPPAGATMVLPIERVLSQLAHGSVKINFGELRVAAPNLFVNSGGENDSRPVTLPLNEILARLNLALLSRRPVQKSVEVDDDVTGPFEGGGQGITFTTTPLKPAPAPVPAPAPRTNVPVSWPVIPPNPIAPPIAPPAFASRAITPAPAPARPAPRNGNGNDVFLPPAISAAPAPPMTPAARPAIPPVPSQPTVFAPLATLSENWPEALRREIAQMNLANAQVALPANLVEPALKRGRVIFAWRNVRSWIRPTPPRVSAHDGVELELPLKVLAPLFFSPQKMAARTRRKVVVTSEIPNLFFGFPQPQPPPEMAAPARDVAALASEVAAPAPEAVAPAPETARPALKPVDAKLSDTNYYVWSDNGEAPKIDETEYKRSRTPATDFSSRRALPKDLVARAMELPGVVGAIIALPDGLRVASQVPAELNADTLAAFLPQIFERVSQSTKELRMGALNNVNFTVGNVPWKIFRVNAVYFAAFGRAGEALPTAQLATLAAGLDRKKQ
jgi:predicted regulator of Ras-like GTPase activity (Roadblock/LC7/MglB family)